MRMWNVNPKLMCRRHLLGEHLEMHMFKGAIENRQKILGYEKGLLVRGKIKKRHDELVCEMKERGYNHKTPIKKFAEGKGGSVDVKKNILELLRRCSECRKIKHK